MKASLNWLREIVDFQENADALATLLTMAGVEVEGIHPTGASFDKVVAAQILSSEQHPNADRLSVCKVDDGSGTPLQIVCGAKNYKVGDKVLLAQAGAVLPGDFKIKVGKLRGIESEGMLCGADELGLAKESEGLLLLDPATVPGTPISHLFPSDTVLDLEVTPNRPDLLSHEGMAREVAALTGRAWKPASSFLTEAALLNALSVSARECPLYTVRQFTGVKVGPSPDWMKQRLETIGLRSINNVVDTTNWILMESGQPLHAFDTDKLQGPLRVRFAAEGESLVALDGKTYKLSQKDLVIADDSGPVAIAGVMGGLGTAVTESTKRVSLESAVFEPGCIRRTSRSLGLSSDSSYRFERGVDLAGVVRASQRAEELLGQVAGASQADLQTGVGVEGVDIGALLMGLTPVLHVPLRAERITSLLGASVPDARVDQILSALGLSRSEDGWDVPSRRADLTREVDLIEEIARVVGIAHFPASTRGRFVGSSAADQRYDRLMVLRRAAVAQGLFESRSLTLVSESMAEGPFVQTPTRRVKNPLNEDQVVLRPALVPGLLQAAARNARAGVRAIRLFEVGRAFSAEGAEERTHLGLILAGPAWTPNWRSAAVQEVDLFDLKGVLSAVLDGRVEFKTQPTSGILGLAVEVLLNGERVGVAGVLRPSEARALDVPGSLMAAEITLDGLLFVMPEQAIYRELPRFPAVTRDMALVAPCGLSHGRVVEVLESAKEELLQSVALFDVFTDATGERVPMGSKSLGYSLTYRASDRTLTADEVNAAHGRLKQRVTAELGVLARE
jgi:phenylalanyl-tRNA synthetase beta chain